MLLFVIIDVFLILLIVFLLLRITRKRAEKRKKTDSVIDRPVPVDEKAEALSDVEPEVEEKKNPSFAREEPARPSVGMTIEERKGFLGEQALYNQIKQVQEVGAKVIWDCWLRFPNRTITQADILLIWKSGVYVIESKNWTGCEVSGLEDDERWTIKRYDWKGEVVSSKLSRNPVKQNAIHADCVRKRIGNLAPVYSIIAFHDSCRLVGVPEKTEDTAVVNYSELRQTIADFHVSGKKDWLSLESIQVLSEFFETMSYEVTEEEKSLHNSRIRNKSSEMFCNEN